MVGEILLAKDQKVQLTERFPLGGESMRFALWLPAGATGTVDADVREPSSCAFIPAHAWVNIEHDFFDISIYVPVEKLQPC